ncbi:MAG: DUF3267 domain-containing protein [Bacilli bacterium]|nr:DUF3267 domain-containing protein [Bacilli bacterium]
MNKNENFVTSIPDNYVLIKHINAKDNHKTMLLLTIFSFIPMLIIEPILYFVAKKYFSLNIGENFVELLFVPIILLISLILYVILHELTHGVTYKIFTGAKLTYGFNLAVAFCGVPDIYVKRKTSMCALLAPFVIFSIILIPLTIILLFVNPLYALASGIVLSSHLGGCDGDLLWVYYYLIKYKNLNTLMRDTGPEQWLYAPRIEVEACGIKILNEK